MSQKNQVENQTFNQVVGQTIYSGFYNAATTQPESQIEATREKEKERHSSNKKWWPNFISSNNLFPQVVAWTKLNSPTNRAIIASKTSISKGAGLRYFKDGEELEQNALSDLNIPFLENPSGQSFFDIYNLLGRGLEQFITSGNLYGVMKRGQSGDTKAYQVKFIDHTKCRLSHDDKQLLVNPYWDDIRNNTSSQFLDQTKKYDLWNFQGEMPTEFAFHLKRDEDGYDRYGVPDYWAGSKDALIEYLVDVYNKARLENGHFTDVWISYFGQPPQGTTPEAFLKSEYEKSSGAHNAGKPRMSLHSSPENAPKIDFASNSKEGEFLQLEESAFNGIVRSHRWFPSLAGIQTAGQLGSNQQIRNEYNIVLSQVVPDYQEPVLKVLNKILELAETGIRIEVINRMPISFDDKIEPRDVLTVNETRKLMKMPNLPDDYMYKDGATDEYFGDMLIRDMFSKLNQKDNINGSN
jgi:hypothetical protein